MPTQYLRAYCKREDVAQSKPGDPIRFIASTENVARDGLIIEAGGWQLDNYRKNPVFLWAHDYSGKVPPIGKASASVDGKTLLADVTFDQNDPFAVSIERKYRDGFLSAVSVGWDTLEVQPSKGPNQAPRITRAELLDISAVPVPGDPDALKERQVRALRDLANIYELPEKPRAAIPPHTTPKAAEDAAWDAGAELKQADGKDQLRRMCAWVDDNGDPDAKQSYKLPHHLAEGDVVWRGVAAAMARLLQAGTQIPDADRKGVYTHLARHYKQFDKEAPEFRTNAELGALGPDEIRGLFLEGEPELFPQLFKRAESDMSMTDMAAMLKKILSVVQDLAEEEKQEDEQQGATAEHARAGAVLSGRNRSDLEQAVTLVTGVLERAKKEEAQDDAHALDEIAARAFLTSLK